MAAGRGLLYYRLSLPRLIVRDTWPFPVTYLFKRDPRSRRPSRRESRRTHNYNRGNGILCSNSRQRYLEVRV